MAAIRIKRGNGTPSNLIPGELAYSNDQNVLYIGHPSDGTATKISTDSIVFATSSDNDKIILEEPSGSGSESITLTTSNLSGDRTITLPASLPASEKMITIDGAGQLEYTDPAISTLQTVGDVDDTTPDDTILVYNGSSWDAKTVAEMKDILALEVTDDQTWVNLTLSGDLTVNGDSVVMNSTSLVIADKNIGLGTDSSTDADADGSGILFPGTSMKSILWNDTNDHFAFTGGDLTVSGDQLYLGGDSTAKKVLDNNDNGSKTLNTDIGISSSQIEGTIDGGTY
jgi:hypothetical protein